MVPVPPFRRPKDGLKTVNYALKRLDKNTGKNRTGNDFEADMTKRKEPGCSDITRKAAGTSRACTTFFRRALRRKTSRTEAAYNDKLMRESVPTLIVADVLEVPTADVRLQRRVCGDKSHNP